MRLQPDNCNRHLSKGPSKVAIHWATARSAEVSPENRAFAHDLIDAGADVILGHHPPHPKGIEVYHGKVILYAPSNVLRGHNGPNLDDGYLARFTLGPKSVEKVEVLPIIGKGQPEGHTGAYDSKLFQPALMQGANALSSSRTSAVARLHWIPQWRSTARKASSRFRVNKVRARKKIWPTSASGEVAPPSPGRVKAFLDMSPSASATKQG
jgi:hypothetical protein